MSAPNSQHKNPPHGSERMLLFILGFIQKLLDNKTVPESFDDKNQLTITTLLLMQAHTLILRC